MSEVFTVNSLFGQNMRICLKVYYIKYSSGSKYENKR